MAVRILASLKKKCSLLLATTLAVLGCGPEALKPTGMDRTPDAPAVQAQQPLMYAGHDYLFVRSARTWPDAKATCESLGYGLVTINNAAEEAWLQSMESPHSWWIGYNDQQSEGSWTWSHGSSSYTNWASWQPDNAGNTEDCAHDNFNAAGQWNDLPCSSALYFVCESLQ